MNETDTFYSYKTSILLSNTHCKMPETKQTNKQYKIQNYTQCDKILTLTFVTDHMCVITIHM